MRPRVLLDVMTAIEKRRSVRAFAPDPLDEATVRALLDAAVQAPTAIHLEPWAFVVVQDRALLGRVSDDAKARWLAQSGGREQHVVAAVPAASAFARAIHDPAFNIFYDAGTLVVIGARALGEFVAADCWLAAENLMLAACAMGLGTCVIGSALASLRTPATKELLRVPADVEPIAPIIVGVPRGEMLASPRRPPEIVAWTRG